MAYLLASAATMVGAMVVANEIIQKGPEVYHGLKDRYRESRRVRKERRLLKKFHKQARKENQKRMNEVTHQEIFVEESTLNDQPCTPSAPPAPPEYYCCYSSM